MSLTRVPFSDLVTFTRASEAWALDANGIWQKSLTNVPRFDWRTGKRAQLIEAQTQNYVWNSGFSGAAVGVVGAGGALPSGWIVGLSDTVEVLEIGTYRGVPAIRLALSYTNSSGSTMYPSFANSDSLSGRADTTTYTVSGAARFVSMTGASAVPRLMAKDIGGTIGNFAIESFTNSGDWEEIEKTDTTGTGGSSLSFAYVFAVADGNTLSVDAWFAMPQLELGATRTSFIQTPVGSGATRAADLTSKDLSAYDFSTGITVSFEGNLGAVVDTYDRCLTVSDGTSDNVILLFYNKPGASLELAVKAGGVTQVSQSLGAGLGTDVKAAVSVSAAGDIVVVLDGTTKASVSGKTLPALNLLRIGRDPAGFNIPAVLHQHETLVKEGPSTEAELKALTA